MPKIVEFQTATIDFDVTRLLTEKRHDGTHWEIYGPVWYLARDGYTPDNGPVWYLARDGYTPDMRIPMVRVEDETAKTTKILPAPNTYPTGYKHPDLVH